MTNGPFNARIQQLSSNISSIASDFCLPAAKI